MLNVMVCDDAIFMRKFLKKVIEQNGNKVIAEATNPDETIDFYTQYKPDLMLLDIIMPRGEKASDGIEALRAIISQDPKAKIVMCSSLGQEKLIEEAKQIGAVDFIAKPFQPKQITQVLSKFA
jgi:two-component system, chemotaxis family, chemotaxis protein CheY